MSENKFSAYDQLASIFRIHTELAHEIDELQAQKWLPADEPRLDQIIWDIKVRRRTQYYLLTDANPDMPDLLKEAQSQKSLLPLEQANLREMKRLYELTVGATHINQISELEDTMRNSEGDWLKTYQHYEDALSQSGDPENADNIALACSSAFEKQKPVLLSIFKLRRDIACGTADLRGVDISEVLLDEWNPGATNAQVDAFMNSAKEQYRYHLKGMKDYLQTINEPAPLPVLDMSEEEYRQSAAALFKDMRDTILEASGWNQSALEKAGIKKPELDLLPNPFCWGSPQDIRIAIEDGSSISEDKRIRLMAGITNAMHEIGGHMTYLLSLNKQDEALRKQPVGQLNGYSTHEVAAMYFDQLSGRPEFLKFMPELIKKHFGVDWPLEDLHAHMNRPDLEKMGWGSSELALLPSMAWRIKAERHMLDAPNNKALKERLNDLPKIWADTMTEWTGVRPDPKHFMVCETHWFDRQMGYFYAYVHGTVGAASLHQKYEKDLASNFAKADGTLKSFLARHIQKLSTDIYSKASQQRVVTPGTTKPA